MKNKLILFGVISILIVTCIFFAMDYFQEDKINRLTSQKASLTTNINIENQPIIGDVNAPITIVEFFDLKCPPCWQWEKNIFPILKQKYIDTKKAKIVFINSPFKNHGKDAYLGALSLEAAYKQHPNSFFELLNALFSYQESPDKTWITMDLIKTLVTNIKTLNVDKLIQDLDTPEIQKKLDYDLQITHDAQITSTPTVYINNRRVESVINTENGKQIHSTPFNLTKIGKMIQEELEKNND